MTIRTKCDDGDRRAKCLSCGYSLRGLPRPYICPECGVEHGENVAIFAEPRTAWMVLAVASWIVVVVLAVLWILGHSPSDPLRPMLTSVLMASIWSWHVRTPRHFVSVSKTHVTIIRGHGDAYRIRLEDIATAHWSMVTGNVRIENKDGVEIAAIKQRFLGSACSARRLVKELRTRTATL
jgi:hypothetical protein